MEQYDYSTELVSKWTQSGYLTGVSNDDLTRVAQRLEAAYRRTLGQSGDDGAVHKEITSLRREGYYGRPQRQVNSGRRRR